MDASQCERFLRMLGCRKISLSMKWARSTCPLGHLHKNGVDKTPSFAISVNPGDKSNCRCQGCGFGGDLMSLLWRLQEDGRPVNPEAISFLLRYNQLDAAKIVDDDEGGSDKGLMGRIRGARKYGARPKRVSRFVHPDDEPQAEVPESVLKGMVNALTPAVIEYLTREPNRVQGLKGRRLDAWTIAEWELGWAPLQRRICIPIRDEEGKLVSVSGRAFDDSVQGPKYLHSPFKRDRVLFGEHKVDKSKRFGYLFEGFFQAIYSWQNGYPNTVARMGTHLSAQQLKKLVDWFDHLVIVPDGDKAGRESAERIKIEVGTLIQVDVIDMPKGRDADNLNPKRHREVLGPPITA